jgi:hypothetical protein
MASKKFLNPINLLNLASDPSSATEGDVYFNTTNDAVKVYANGAWVAIGSDGGASTSSVYLVRNNTGSTILKGTLVSASGAEPSGRIDVEPFAAVGGINSELTVMGMATANISNGVNGEVISFGTLTGIDTRGDTTSAIAVGDETWAAGDILFAHPTVAGKLTKVRPQHDLAVAFITVRHASTGQIAVRIVPGNNHLEWMHDVLIDGTPADNEVLAYDTTSGLWKNQTAAEAGLATVTDLESYQPLDADLSAIGALTGSSGILRKESANNWALDTNTYVSATALDSYAPLNSPELTGSPLATTASAGDNSTRIATTEFVATSFAPIAEPTFTGTVSLPSTTSIGTVTATSVQYLTDVSSNIQAQLDSKPTKIDGFILETEIPLEIARVEDISSSTTGYVPVTQKGIAGGVATLDDDGKVPSTQLDLLLIATLTGPTFTGNVVLPSTTSIGNISAEEIGHLDGVTSSIQTQINDKLSTATAESTYLSITTASSQYLLQSDATTNYQPKDGDLTAIAALTGTSGFLKKSGADTWALDDSTYLTTSQAIATYLDIDDAINSYAPLAAPTFTGIVVLPSTTSIGTVSATEIGYLDGVTSSIQTQLNGKEASHSHPYQTSNASLSSIAALAGTAGFIKFDGGSTYTVDSNTYLVRNQPTVDTAIIAGTTTFSVANAIATTLNIGGAATEITIGSTNANAETIIRTPKINSNASSIQLFNATSTTIEFAGAATTLHVGGTSTAGSTFNIATNATASGNQKILNLATGGVSGSSTIINVGSDNDGTVNLYGDVMVNGTIEVPTPTSNAQAANKGYVDALAAGINIKEQASYATTIALDVTYTAGTSDSSGGLGIGATITATSNGALSPDGTEVVSGERVLVKNQTDAKQNGIYTVTDPGDGDSPFILTRAADFNGESTTNGTVKNGDYVFITGGSTNSNASFVISQSGTSTSPSGAIKFGTDNVLFSQYSGVPGNITSLGVVTVGVWNSTRIQKEFLDDELATLANPTFTGSVTVPEPVVDSDAANKQYVDDSIFANAAALPDIIPIDDIRGQFNGIDSRFQPKFQGETLSILNPLRLLLSVNGIIQTVDFPEYVWQSFLPREGFMVDSDGYIAFSEVPPAGSTFDARLMPGPNINSVKKGYPFKAVDILLGV